MVESLFRGHYARRAAPDNSGRIGMFIATAPPGHPQLRRSGMFIGTATNNGLRKGKTGFLFIFLSSLPPGWLPLQTSLDQ